MRCNASSATKAQLLRNVGGQHSASVGTSTRDDERLALWLFEQDRQRYAGQADVGW
jgi:hypothetical protein